MNLFQAVFLGVVQGLTEFLPVSSSGHLVLFQRLFGLMQPELLFDVCLHFGTLIAIFTVFYRDIFALLKSVFTLPVTLTRKGGLRALYDDSDDFRLAVLIVVGSAPTAVMGLAFKQIADRLFSAVGVVGVMLLVTGALLWATRRRDGRGRPLSRMRWTDALLIGFVQGLAILPGISRSGATISAALFMGLDREVAGRFSFLLSLPAIFGALLISMEPAGLHGSSRFIAIAAGTLAAALVGYGALVVLLRIVKKGKLHRFAPYCWAVGVVAILWAWF